MEKEKEIWEREMEEGVIPFHQQEGKSTLLQLRAQEPNDQETRARKRYREGARK